MKTSGAVMLRDLANEFLAQNDSVSVIIPNDVQNDLLVEIIQGDLCVFQVKAFKSKDVSYLRRILAEFFNPFLMWHRLKSSQRFTESPVDLIVWYSPSIFWGPLVRRIKNRWGCPSYLVLRDMFPDWAVHLELISKYNPISFLLNWVAIFQYRQATFIGVQSPNNQRYMSFEHPTLAPKIKVLWNWMRAEEPQDKCAIRISESSLAGKTIFVYAGNIGVAQGVDMFLKIIESFQGHDNIGFIFVGRGSEMSELKECVFDAGLKNVLFYSEIPSNQINDLYAQCHVGMIALDVRHKTHNIPGKFISYMHAGLPVFGIVNPGNDLIELVRVNHLGFIGDSSSADYLSQAANQFLKQLLKDAYIRKRCIGIGNSLFSSSRAAIEIKSSLI
jgi:glycosyltransferase involved in cell wall biosynthesis